MKLVVESGLIKFIDLYQRSSMSMHGPKGGLPKNDAAPRFSDGTRSYSWAFALVDHMVEGQQLTTRPAGEATTPPIPYEVAVIAPHESRQVGPRLSSLLVETRGLQLRRVN